MFGGGQEQGFLPHRQIVFALLFRRALRFPARHVPVKDALRRITDSSGRSEQQAPIGCLPNFVGAKPLLRLRADSVLGWHEHYERPRRLAGPGLCKGPGKRQLQGVVCKIGDCLVAKNVHPGLIAKLIQEPGCAAGVE